MKLSKRIRNLFRKGGRPRTRHSGRSVPYEGYYNAYYQPNYKAYPDLSSKESPAVSKPEEVKSTVTNKTLRAIGACHIAGIDIF